MRTRRTREGQPTRWALALTVPLALLTVLSCSAHSNDNAGSLDTAHGDSMGTVHGHLAFVGGPAPGAPRPVPGSVTLSGPSHVEVQVARDGQYVATLAPGVYTVTGHSPLYGSGKYLCQAEKTVTVRPGRAAQADVRCQLR